MAQLRCTNVAFCCNGCATFSVDGANGRLLEVTDDLSCSIFSANTIAGLPVVEAFANYCVSMGQYGGHKFEVTCTGIRGGKCTTTSGFYSIVTGGCCNASMGGGGTSCSAYDAVGTFVGGGYWNCAEVSLTRPAGFPNVAPFVGGGQGNLACASGAVVVGGGPSVVSFGCAGTNNRAAGINSFVGGGSINIASGEASVVVGGSCNCATGAGGGTMSGNCNFNTGACSFIGGGCRNTNSGVYSFIGGGQQNCICSNNGNTISGGAGNLINTGNYNTIGGGISNCVLNSNRATVGGGCANTASGNYSTVAGGAFNTASGYGSAVLGGLSNCASATYSGAFGIGLSANVACTFFTNNQCTCGNINASGNITASNLSSGTHSPVAATTANVSSFTNYTNTFMRVGSVVTVSGRIDITPALTGNATVGITLPIASNFTATTDLNGTITSLGQRLGTITADTTNDIAQITVFAAGGASVTYTFVYQYIIQ